jgi:hypothetical protein
MVKGRSGSVQLLFAGFGRLSNGKNYIGPNAIPVGASLLAMAACQLALLLLTEYISVFAVTAT